MAIYIYVTCRDVGWLESSGSSRGALSRKVAIDIWSRFHQAISVIRIRKTRNTRRQSVVSLSELSGKQADRIKSFGDLSRSTMWHERVLTSFTCGNAARLMGNEVSLLSQGGRIDSFAYREHVQSFQISARIPRQPRSDRFLHEDVDS